MTSSNGGSSTTSQTVLDGDAASVPSNPNYTGYLFQGWFTAASGGSLWDATDPVTEDRTLYAQWSLIPPDTHVVSFQSHGGSAEPDQSITDGDPVVEPTDPTRPGYQFDGWFTEEFDGDLWDFTTTITDGLTLHAQWTAIEWTVDFDSQGGSSEADQTVLDSFRATEPVDPTRAHYVFDGWYTDPTAGSLWAFDVDGVYTDTTLFAHWIAIDWTVSFEPAGGSAVGDQTVLDGNAASDPGVPTRAGYVFAGWFDAPVAGAAWDFAAGITQDTTIYAQWNEVWTVTFDSHGGSAVSSQDVTDGGTATAPADPVLAGFVFLGWDDDIDGGSPWAFSTPIVDDTTLHAQWAPIWTVTFASNGGSAVGDVDVQDGDSVDEPTEPTRFGYLFGGWFLLDDTAWDFGDPITEDTDLYAHWNPVQWLVSFDTQGGGIIGSQLVGTGALANFPGIPNRPGQTFLGWFTAPSGGVPFAFTLEAIGSDITLYAHWQAAAAVPVAPAGQALAATGADASRWAWLALALVAAGTVFQGLANRQRARQQSRS